ncbi:MAG: acyl--CoA ligase, partial [Deltaproteobacteria bacterium]|nr:acyl--CoA ligase [Deltaproteobacteria bacterium]
MGDESLRHYFSDSFLVHGDKKAISFFRGGVVETELSYRELNQDSSRMANAFLEMGVGKGDRAILYLPKSLGFIVAHLALQKIGAIAVPLNPGFKQSEMDYLCKDSEAKLVVSGSEQETIMRSIDPSLNIVVICTEKPYQDLDFFRSASDGMPQIEIRPEDPGLIIYTSGTTGKPKGALLTHRNLAHDAGSIINIWEITESDVLCHALPLFHV